jgi:hypothetical protein
MKHAMTLAMTTRPFVKKLEILRTNYIPHGSVRMYLLEIGRIECGQKIGGIIRWD